MKTKEQYFKEAKEEEKRKSEKRRVKWRNEILEEISEWDFEKLKEEYILTRLGRISCNGPISAGLIWNMCKEECRFCSLEYISGKHDDCCDDCWDKNKNKTLEELDND